MLNCQRDKFSLPETGTFLNCAYMSPLLKSVEQVGIESIMKKRDPSAIKPEDFFKESESLRAEYSKLINVSDSLRIVIIPSVSYGMANVTANIKLSANDNVVVLGEQFPSNYYPWQRLCQKNGATLKVVKSSNSQNRGEDWNADILSGINEKTKAVAMCHVHWADGTKFDLKAIRKRTREVGALLIIDGTQSVGALPFDVQEIQPDALVCAGYKWLLGPYAIGLAYYGEAFDGGMPIEENWINRLKSEDFSGLVSYEERYQPGALKYEVGEHSNFILVPMMLEAVKQINEWKPENIQSYCEKITSSGLEKLTGVTIEKKDFRASHLFGIRLPQNLSMNSVRQLLADEQISASIRGDAIRIAPHLYNTSEDIERLASCMSRVLVN